MKEWRWYPTAITLRDGRALVLSGARHRHHRIFGGLRGGSLPSSPVSDSLYRFMSVIDGRWDKAVVPAADPTNGRPEPRQRHSMAQMQAVTGIQADALFGGQGGSAALNDVWFLYRDDNVLGDDYGYRWLKQTTIGGTAPPIRSDHGVVVSHESQMVVYGGRNGTLVRDDVHRLYKDPAGLHWEQITPSGTAPPARYGHAAIYDETTVSESPRKRMIVFGGAASTSSNPTDQKVWELRFDSPSSATWYEMTVVDVDSGGAKPAPRHGHTLTMDPAPREIFTGGQWRLGHVAYLFGGQLTSSAYSDSLWALWIFDDGTVGWQRRAFSGTAPSARARHTAVVDKNDGQLGAPLYIYGGENASGSTDKHAYTVDPWASSPSWSSWAEASGALAGHSITLDQASTLARVAETYDPATATWQGHNSTTLLQDTYPVAFLVPNTSAAGGRVVTNDFYGQTRYVDFPAAGQSAGGWQSFNPNAQLGYYGKTGTMYLPGKLMMAGGGVGSSVVGTTKTLDVSNLNNSWQSAGTMKARFNHALVQLPTGKVLAVGGDSSFIGFERLYPAHRPQIWDPGGATWTDTTALETQPTSRGYHSTAILLPDGRVLSGGGEYPGDKYKFNVFCPPYLFDPGTTNLAGRPQIAAWHDAIAYGQTFQIWAAGGDTIVSVCLLKPGAMTHAFNEDQRYVPLTFTVLQVTGACQQLEATAPSGSDVAPPGDYLLFILKKHPSDPTHHVPSLGQWVRVRSGSATPPPDPGPCAGGGGCPVADIRTEAGWKVENTILGRSRDQRLATDFYRVKQEPVVAGGLVELRIREDEQEVTTLDQARLVAVDHEPYQRALTTQAGFVLAQPRPAYRVVRESGEEITALVSGTGGRFQGRPGDALLVDLLAPGEEPAPESIAPGGVVEYEEKQGPSQGGGASLRPSGGLTPAAIDAAVLDRSGILVQVPDGAGGWRTIEHRYPRETMDEAVIATGGFARLRLEFVGHHRLGFVGRMEPLGSATGIEQRAVHAWHSRLGDVGPILAAADGRTTTLSPGDTITLAFEATTQVPGAVRDYFLVTHGVYTALAPGAGDASLSLRFALHQNQPNPFVRTTTIGFELASACRVKLEVFDLLGRRVRTLVDGPYRPGGHQVEWDRRDGRGDRVRSGIYIYRLTAGTFRDQRRMVLLAQ